MPNHPVNSRPKADNEYSVKKSRNHNDLCSRRIMFIQSAALQQTRCSNQPQVGLSWSDLQKSKYESREEMLDAVVVGICLTGLLFFWLVVPELFRV